MDQAERRVWLSAEIGTLLAVVDRLKTEFTNRGLWPADGSGSDPTNPRLVSGDALLVAARVVIRRALSPKLHPGRSIAVDVDDVED